jgi:acetoacetyl-[acyl-carrier protein] synthase
VARAVGIEHWPVAAIKCYVGHSLASSSGDQIAATLGTWDQGWLPGIRTTTALAGDVATDNLAFNLEHRELDLSVQRYALINSKGFGGNNATAALLSPVQTMSMLRDRHGEQALQQWQRAQEPVQLAREYRESRVLAGKEGPRYLFDNNVLGDASVTFDDQGVSIGGLHVSLTPPNPLADEQ